VRVEGEGGRINMGKTTVAKGLPFQTKRALEVGAMAAVACVSPRFGVNVGEGVMSIMSTLPTC